MRIGVSQNGKNTSFSKREGGGDMVFTILNRISSSVLNLYYAKFPRLKRNVVSSSEAN